MCFVLRCNNAVNQFSHAVEESFTNGHWQANGNQCLGANIGTRFNFFSSSLRRVQIYTLVQRKRNTHTGADAEHTTYSERAPTVLQVLIYIQLEMSIYSSCNLRLWLLIPMCVCVCPSVSCPFSVSDFAAIWYVRVSLCLCERVVMCLGYQVCQTATTSAGRPPHTGSIWWLSSPLIPSLLHIFSFDSQTQ